MLASFLMVSVLLGLLARWSAKGLEPHPSGLSMNEFVFKTEKIGDVLVISASPGLFDKLVIAEDTKMQSDLVSAFQSSIPDSVNSVVLDFSGFRVLNSLAINVIVRMLVSRPRHVTRFAVCGKAYLQEIWEFMKLENNLCPCYKSVEEALESVKS